jgi:hypothetical protein
VIDHGRQKLLERERVLHTAGAVGSPAQLTQIGTGAEVGALAGEEHDARLRVDGRITESPGQFAKHPGRDGVSGIRPVQGEAPYATGLRSDQRHPLTLAGNGRVSFPFAGASHLPRVACMALKRWAVVLSRERDVDLVDNGLVLSAGSFTLGAPK